MIVSHKLKVNQWRALKIIFDYIKIVSMHLCFSVKILIDITLCRQMNCLDIWSKFGFVCPGEKNIPYSLAEALVSAIIGNKFENVLKFSVSPTISGVFLVVWNQKIFPIYFYRQKKTWGLGDIRKERKLSRFTPQKPALKNLKLRNKK